MSGPSFAIVPYRNSFERLGKGLVFRHPHGNFGPWNAGFFKACTLAAFWLMSGDLVNG